MVAFFAMRYLPFGPFPLDLSRAQIIILPFVFVSFLFLFIPSYLPRFVLGAALICALIGMSVGHFKTDSDSALIFSRFSNDEFETKTFEFLEGLEKYLVNETNLNISRSSQSFKSDKELRDSGIIDRSLPVIWGDEHRLKVSFPQLQNVKLKEIAYKELNEQLPELKLVSSIPVVGLSIRPKEDTYQFLASLAAGMQREDDLGMMQLRSAASIVAPWTSFAHRAYPWWLVGTRHLIQVLKHEDYEPAVLKCALRAFKKASSFLRFGDNAELRAAIFNNTGVALFLQSILEYDLKLRKLAKKKFRIAFRLKFKPNQFGVDYRAGKVARMNLKRVINSSVNEKRQSRRMANKKKRKKKKRKVS